MKEAIGLYTLLLRLLQLRYSAGPTRTPKIGTLQTYATRWTTVTNRWLAGLAALIGLFVVHFLVNFVFDSVWLILTPKAST